MKKILIILLVLAPFASHAARVNTYKILPIEGFLVLMDEDLIKADPRIEKVGIPNLKKCLKLEIK